MKNYILPVLAAILFISTSCGNKKEKSESIVKPNAVEKNDFLFGVASAAYQIEGSYQEDGKGESKWDFATNTVGVTKFIIGEKHTGNVAANMYDREQYLKDLKLLQDMGANAYRFSLDWSRIIPDGTGEVNELAIAHYDQLIDDCKSFGLEPVVTLYHFDYPMVLVKKGGWANPEMGNWFKNYASVVFDRFGEKVNYFITFNEPYIEFLVAEYLMNLEQSKDADVLRFSRGYAKAYRQILASAETVKLYKEKGLKGSIGITLNLSPTLPFDPSNDLDVKAAALQDKLLNTFLLDPILKGSFPSQVKDSVQKYVPEFNPTEKELKFLGDNKPDFLGINFYAPALVKYDALVPFSTTWMGLNTDEVKSHNGPVRPDELYNLLMRLKKEYNNPVMMITENGAGFEGEDVKETPVVKDPLRADFIKRHINSALKAKEDGANLIGYMAWSGWDNFEWVFGYTARFGLIYVDFETQERIPKESYYEYQKILKEKKGLKVN
ncbi:glycoside hydrolase family 1 protein [Thalassobellus suaedae]|uniref:Family 1 glycosylhydrolase n=1 Tax=Thalassobellus suaedae TaxID=3074124 RepID=A0ABY9Y318_9FLAO|nr:family 1 glycosylhydrolase [Flavobacteriaceae bacterium HL-DH10]